MKYYNQAKKYGSQIIVGTGLAVTSFASHAYIPATELTASATELTTDLNTAFSTYFPVIMLGLGLTVGIVIVKRFVKKI